MDCYACNRRINILDCFDGLAILTRRGLRHTYCGAQKDFERDRDTYVAELATVRRLSASLLTRPRQPRK